MRLRLILSNIVCAALAASPCCAKVSHAHHVVRGSTTGTAVTGGKGTIGANPPPKANLPTDARETVAPPVLPPRGITQQQIRITNPKTTTTTILLNAPRGQAGAMTSLAPAARNAIGQGVIPPKNLIGTQAVVPTALRASGVSGSTVSPISARVNVANASNRGNGNSATAIRPAIPAVGGPAQPHYGLNGTMVKNRR